MIKQIINHWQLVFLTVVATVFFLPFIVSGKTPIPADTIVGLYHPFRDEVWDSFTTGVPFKNFLITDPVRQQYPWRLEAINLLKNGQWPLLNSFNFSSALLLANLQSAAFYPLNFLYWLFSFNLAWGVQVLLQLLLGGFFFYLWLRVYGVSKTACLLGALSFIFSGFFVAWLEWNTILQAALWLPLFILAKEKIIRHIEGKVNNLEDIFNKQIFLWSLVLIFAEISCFFAGHLQTYFYVVLVATLYLVVRFLQLFFERSEKSKTVLGFQPRTIRLFIYHIRYQLLLFSSTAIIIFLFISLQLLPTLQFIFTSARSFDQPLGFRLDWYLPWKHLAQFIAPDFFGNPATLNYWGNWNYGEFVGYIGIIPLLLAMVAIVTRRDKKTWFFFFLVVFSLLFALPNPISFLPYQLHLPLISTTAPSRLIFVTDFSLAVLAALGLDAILRKKHTRGIILSGLITGAMLTFLWISVLFNFWKTDAINLVVAKKNLLLPTVIFVMGLVILFLISRHSGEAEGRLQNQKKERFWTSQNDAIKTGFLLILLILTSFDLLRFSQKFNPFVKQEWIFPQTKTISYLQKQVKPFRIESLDDRILPPNFSGVYGLETIEGYDPLVDLRYAQFIASVERNKPDISSFNFNRIITPKLYDNAFVNVLNVKYFLTLSDLDSKNVKKVYQEGQTRLYENLQVMPRAFFVNKIVMTKTPQESINQVFLYKEELNKTAVVESGSLLPKINRANFSGTAVIKNYQAQNLKLETQTNGRGFLVLSQSFLPGWKAKIDGVKTELYQTDFALMGLVVPAGKHKVSIYYQSFLFLLGLANFVLGIIIMLIWGIKVWLKKRLV